MKLSFNYIFVILMFSSCAFEDPYFMTIEIYGKTDNDMDIRRIAIEGKWSDVEDIPIAVYLKTIDLDSIQKTKFFVKLKINRNASMGIVSDVKYELRKAKIQNVRYYDYEDKRFWSYQ